MPPLADSRTASPAMKLLPLPEMITSLPRPARIQLFPFPAVMTSLNPLLEFKRTDVISPPK